VDVEEFGKLAGAGKFYARSDAAAFDLQGDGIGDLEVDGGRVVLEKSVELAEPAWDVRLPCRPSGTKKYI
jgi:hypothetical protein